MFLFLFIIEWVPTHPTTTATVTLLWRCLLRSLMIPRCDPESLTGRRVLLRQDPSRQIFLITHHQRTGMPRSQPKQAILFRCLRNKIPEPISNPSPFLHRNNAAHSWRVNRLCRHRLSPPKMKMLQVSSRSSVFVLVIACK